MTKACPDCREDKSLDEFSPAKKGRLGRAYRCRPCAATYQRAYNQRPEIKVRNAERVRVYLRSNPEQAALDRKRSLAWAKANPEATRARNAAWRGANPEKVSASSAKWRQGNPDLAREHVERRRARIAGAAICDFTVAEWRDLLEEFNHSCGYCLTTGVPLQQEHMTPISRGGDHTKSNIIPACGTCNNRKGARTLLESLPILQRSA